MLSVKLTADTFPALLSVFSVVLKIEKCGIEKFFLIWLYNKL